jgi:co-chaperonin GroES (HSP10)
MSNPDNLARNAVRILHDRVLLDAPPKAEENAEKMVDGIIIPAMASGASQNSLVSPHAIMRVLAAGSDCKLVQRGQRVVVRKPDCFVVKLGDVENVFIREQHIIAILPG